MLVPGGLQVLGAYGESRSTDAEALEATADALVASVPAQVVGHRFQPLSELMTLQTHPACADPPRSGASWNLASSTCIAYTLRQSIGYRLPEIFKEGTPHVLDARALLTDMQASVLVGFDALQHVNLLLFSRSTVGRQDAAAGGGGRGRAAALVRAARRSVRGSAAGRAAVGHLACRHAHAAAVPPASAAGRFRCAGEPSFSVFVCHTTSSGHRVSASRANSRS